VGRQNGKSVIGSILAVYGLLRESGALVVGLASTAEQARIIYDRLLAIVRAEPRLAKRFKKATDTRGIVATNGSRYEIKASKSNAVQGLATAIGIIDELHITSPALWTDLVNGTAATKGLVFGITTAGDEESDLLKRLYKRAEAEEPAERFGYFIWESPEDRIPEDDDELADFIALANPSVAEGRREMEDEIAAVRSGNDGKEGEADVIHFRLNRFVASLNPYMRGDKWAQARAGEDYEWPTQGQLTFAIDQTMEDTYAVIYAVLKDAEGHFHVDPVAGLVNPSTEGLLRLCEQLYAHGPVKYVMDGIKLRPLGNELKARGYPVSITTGTDTINASSLLYAKVMNGEVTHAGDQLLDLQMARAVRKQKGDAYRIMREGTDIDAVMATALGVYVAEQLQDMPVQVF